MLSTNLQINNLSYWERKTYFDKIDHLIIGAGIVGFSTALKLRELDPTSKIVVIERGYLPSGASTKNAGFACFGSATEIYDDLQKNDPVTVWKTVEMRWKGLQKLRSLLGDDNLKLEINGSWDLITDKEIERYNDTNLLLAEFNENMERISGVKNTYSIDTNVEAKFGLQGVKTSFYNRLEGQIDTASMNIAFYQLIRKNNIHVLFGVEAISIENKYVQSNIGSIQARSVSICTNGFARKFLPLHDVNPARAQVLITKPIKNLQVKGTFHYDCGYYYFRNIDDRILFGGGRNLNFDAETTTDLDTTELIRTALLRILAENILPQTSYEIDYFWAGIMGVGKDKKPIIEKLEDGLFCAVRLGGMGVAIGTLVGEELAQLVMEN